MRGLRYCSCAMCRRTDEPATCYTRLSTKQQEHCVTPSARIGHLRFVGNNAHETVRRKLTVEITNEVFRSQFRRQTLSGAKVESRVPRSGPRCAPPGPRALLAEQTWLLPRELGTSLSSRAQSRNRAVVYPRFRRHDAHSLCVCTTPTTASGDRPPAEHTGSLLRVSRGIALLSHIFIRIIPVGYFAVYLLAVRHVQLIRSVVLTAKYDTARM